MLCSSIHWKRWTLWILQIAPLLLFDTDGCERNHYGWADCMTACSNTDFWIPGCGEFSCECDEPNCCWGRVIGVTGEWLVRLHQLQSGRDEWWVGRPKMGTELKRERLFTKQVFDSRAKSGTARRTLLTILANISGDDILKTVVLAAIGAVVSFWITLLMKSLIKSLRR